MADGHLIIKLVWFTEPPKALSVYYTVIHILTPTHTLTYTYTYPYMYIVTGHLAEVNYTRGYTACIWRSKRLIGPNEPDDRRRALAVDPPPPTPWNLLFWSPFCFIVIVRRTPSGRSYAIKFPDDQGPEPELGYSVTVIPLFFFFKGYRFGFGYGYDTKKYNCHSFIIISYL